MEYCFEFESDYAEELEDVKNKFNAIDELPHDALSVSQICDAAKKMFHSFKMNKPSWTRMQRSVFIMRLINCIVRKCPLFLFSENGVSMRLLRETLLDKVKELFEEENLREEILEYLRYKFSSAYRLYEGWV